MSKAFTRESDDIEEPVLFRPSPALPVGTKNYLTFDGARRMREELDHLIATERHQAVTSTDSEARRELKLIDQRIGHLQQSLRAAVIVPPARPAGNEVRFGATVLVRDREGNETKYRIVGIDEADLNRDWVSWRSPIARALLNAHTGDRIGFRIPAGEEELEILSVSYE